jgi:hypothetical protein
MLAFCQYLPIGQKPSVFRTKIAQKLGEKSLYIGMNSSQYLVYDNAAEVASVIVYSAEWNNPDHT